MKKLFLVLAIVCSAGLVTWAYFGTQEEFELAEGLAEDGIIVDRDTIDEYNLTSYVLRQEVIGIGLNIADIELPDDYTCKGYFIDANFTSADQDLWVCRAAEIAADKGLISRRFDLVASERKTRPQSYVTRVEALAILMQAAGISIDRSVSTTLLMQPWQYQVLYTAHKLGIVKNYQDPESNAQYFGVDAKATRAQVFAYARAILDQQGAGDTCIGIGEYAGGGFVYPPENPDDFVCCSGLSNVPHKDSYQIADIGNVCANVGDGICDENFESWYNSADCQKPVDTTACQSYYDGCNWCFRETLSSEPACTKKYCGNSALEPAYCNACLPGYNLENGICTFGDELEIKGCSAYYDGCNSCTMTQGGETVCTQRACFAFEMSPKYCSACQDGYMLENGKCEAIQVDDFLGCSSYYDGCNSCSLDEESNLQVCTLRYCEDVTDEPRYCTACRDGYTLENGECVNDTVPHYDLSVCSNYYDGCNTCQVVDGEITACTEIYCIQSERPYGDRFLYTQTSYEADLETIEKVDTNIREYAKDLTCTDSSQCETVEYGEKACGGASEYLLYSKLKVSEDVLFGMINDYDKILKDFSEFYNIYSDCMFVQEPNEVLCEAGTCVAR